MAPKNKFTRQQLAAAAMDVVRRQGAGALTAKAVAEALDISTRPIFTCFGTMEALRADVCALAQQRFDEYVAEGLRQEIPFLGYGKQYARFAREEPELYRLLLLTSGDGAALRAMRHSQELVRPSLMEIYHITAAAWARGCTRRWRRLHAGRMCRCCTPALLHRRTTATRT